MNFKNNKSIIIFVSLIIIILSSLILCIEEENKLKKPVFDEQYIEKIDLNFDSQSNKIILNKVSNMSLEIDEIKVIDDYLNYQYIIVLPGDYIDYFFDVEYVFNAEENSDNYINNVIIQNNEDNFTQIIINENAVLGYLIEEDEQNIYITAKPPKEVYKNIVVIDPGHGGVDPGTDGFGVYEKNVNLRISEKLISLLDKNPDIKVYSTRLDDIKIKLPDRVDFGNWLADLFVSIHINANEYYPNVNGTEVYYYNNDDSNRALDSQRAAEIICDEISESTGSKNRGAKNEYFEVISTINVPAVLCEIGFITNYKEALNLGNYDYQWKVAEGIYDAILKLFSDDLEPKSTTEAN